MFDKIQKFDTVWSQWSRIKERIKDQGSRIMDQGSRIMHLVLARLSILEEIRTWYQDSPKLHSSSSPPDRFYSRIHGQNDRLWWSIDFGPCFGTNEHPRRDNDVILRLSKSTTEDLPFQIGFIMEFGVKMVAYDETVTFVMFFLCFFKPMCVIWGSVWFL